MSGAVRTLLVFLAVAGVITAVGVTNAHWSHGSASRAAQAKALPTPPPVTIIAPSVPGSVISPRARYLGVAAPAGQLASFEAASGAHPQILSEYVQVGQPFTTPPPGEMPYISLETSTSVAAVIAGSDDSALGFYGRAVAAYRKPVVISIDPEMNGAWYSYGTKKASHSEFVTLFRHVHDVIEKSGAHNVVWVWAVSNSAPITHTPLLHELYPGDAYVDWVGVDGYYVHLDVHFTGIFTRVFDRIRSFTKRPFIISETSVQPGPYAVQCVQDLFAGVKSTPDLVGFIWFDFNKLSVGREDWRLEDDQDVATAFRMAAVSYAA